LTQNNYATGVSDLMNLGLVMQKIDLNRRFLENLHENIANFKTKTCVSAECHHPLICLNLTPLDIKKKVARLPFLVINFPPDKK
jgi:hypothetical protein